jgi:hypothetical protein
VQKPSNAHSDFCAFFIACDLFGKGENGSGSPRGFPLRRD